MNGKPQRLQKSHLSAGVRQYYCSDSLASLGLLAEGEYLKFDFSRNAMVVITDLKTCELKGWIGRSRETHFPVVLFHKHNL